MDTKIYFIMESEDYDEYGFAFSPEDIEPKVIQNWDKRKEWSIIPFELQGGDYADYLVNDLNIPLCSEKLKHIIENNSPLNKGNLLFYPVDVTHENRTRTYYFLKPPILENVIDTEKSVSQNNTIFQPYFIPEKVENIFRCDYDAEYLLITEDLMKVIQKECVSGIDFYTWDSQESEPSNPKTPEQEEKERLHAERVERARGRWILD